MRDVVRALLIAATLLLLTIPSRFGAAPASFAVATVLMIGVNATLLAMFSSRPPTRSTPYTHTIAALAAASVAALLVTSIARGWLHEILIYPHDSSRADMLVVIQEGLRRVVRGQNPYTMYHVPWDATLPYGPVLWLPYVVPHLLRIDVRFVSMLGALFLPVACALTAAACAWTGRGAAAVASLILLAALAASADLRGFASIAHTPSYWPGIALFAWLAARERWFAAAIVCGLLIVARTTMVATAPVLVMAVWYRDRPRAPVAIILLVLATLLPYLPFAMWNPASLTYALYGSYQHLMKGFVWTSTTWAHNSIGITGLLLRRGLFSFAEPAQIIAMTAVYLFGWRSIRAGGAVLPWMGFALFAFSATTLWPVSYVYFDVTLMWIAAAIADGDWVWPRRVLPAWTVTLAASFAIVAIVAVVEIAPAPAIDVGIGATRPVLYKGFSTDEGTDRTFAWVEGTSAEILVARRSRGDADIELVLEPYLPTTQATQHISVALNGVVLGTAEMREGWHSLSFRAPSPAWRIGVNELTLSLSGAVSPREAHAGDDPRKLSAAIDRITVRTAP